MELGLNQRKWIEALRSGEFKQTKNELYKSGSFCCLGVAACVIEGRPNFMKHVNGWPKGVVREVDPFLDNEWATDKLGLFDGEGRSVDYDDRPALHVLNDDGISFKDIADMLEQHPERYFTKSV